MQAEPIEADDDRFSSLGVAFKRAERNYNIAQVSRLFTREINTQNEYKIIIQNLFINELTYNDFVATRKAAGATDDVLKVEIKEAIVSTISKVLNEKY